ncbi:uracil-DNA glycosylase family protein [Mesobacillus selenatarsenatis]|uniref:Uracil-DNA glycosylase-like domain-containing protein n=1 Tax=Mesobacillus selenatarsenatis (strain DSM 18680 / JCM 14380 / FERM P-15431 / SF-1) TaxID=1321606 RepID=A0A0A8X219_MESS1|nr:uracil-DNA glycosylase family protein [Mesobacillus selenatarsenatis]GAM13953.1 hypothetical protein SAMD00020551_2100 [Mesobacillus selenatarsenatis SF-1]
MNKLEKYYKKIANLPLKESYSRGELLTLDFMMAKENNIEIYYCTHNEYINKKAKVFIVGITPGYQQMSKSIAVARKCLEENLSLDEVAYICKREARFYGVLRSNIIQMLNDLDLNNFLDLKSCEKLFNDKDYLLHTTSLIPYAVFINGKNYTGHSPKIKKNELLTSFLAEFFEPQAALLKDALIIPLGKGVEEIIAEYTRAGIIKENNVLYGFPHPSGANGHRLHQFNSNKEKMKIRINDFFQER